MRFALLLAVSLGCASSTAPATSDRIAEPPFTAEQIRDATQAGRTYVWQMTAEGTTFTRKLTFLTVDAEKATTEALNVAADGTPMGEPEVKSSSWDDFVKHAAWPKDATVISEEKLALPVGEFDCVLYTVNEKREGQNVRTRAWFAKVLPGAPVQLIVDVDGTEVMRLELMEHQPGAAIN
jgi:hypothetical protein